MATETLHFVVAGEHMMNMCRKLVLEGEWEKAVRILSKGLHGISTDQVYSILKGDFALKGMSDDPQGVAYYRDRESLKQSSQYKKDLQWFFSGLIRKEKYWYRPIAHVTNFGPNDMETEEGNFRHVRAPDKINEVGAGGFGKWVDPVGVLGRKNHRIMHYSQDPKTDYCAVVELEGLEICVIFERVEAPPAWMSTELLPRECPLEALKEFLASGRTLEARGHDEWYGKAEQAERLARSREMRIADEEEKPKKKQKNIKDNDYKELRDAIKKQAGNDFTEIKVGDRVYRIPRAPFEHWCLSRHAPSHLLPKWETLSPSGLKMVGDDPYHSDWMLGADLDLDYDAVNVEEGLGKAIWEHRLELMRTRLNFKCDVLSGSGSTDYLKVLHPGENDTIPGDCVIILPNAHPRFLPLIAQITTGAVIVEQGGSVAHLVNIAREQNIKIVRVPKARKLYSTFSTVMVDCDNGTVDMH